MIIEDNFYVATRTALFLDGDACMQIAIYDRRVDPQPRWDYPQGFLGELWRVWVWEKPKERTTDSWKIRVNRAVQQAQEKIDSLNGMERFTTQSAQIHHEASKQITKYLIEAEGELMERCREAITCS